MMSINVTGGPITVQYSFAFHTVLFDIIEPFFMVTAGRSLTCSSFSVQPANTTIVRGISKVQSI